MVAATVELAGLTVLHLGKGLRVHRRGDRVARIAPPGCPSRPLTHSTRVPQPGRTGVHCSGRLGTVTCTDARRRTCRLLMACKGVAFALQPGVLAGAAGC